MAFSTQRQFFYLPIYYDEDDCNEYQCIKLRPYDTDERAWNFDEFVKSQFLQDKVSRKVNEKKCEDNANAFIINKSTKVQNTEETAQQINRYKNSDENGGEDIDSETSEYLDKVITLKENTNQRLKNEIEYGANQNNDENLKKNNQEVQNIHPKKCKIKTTNGKDNNAVISKTTTNYLDFESDPKKEVNVEYPKIDNNKERNSIEKNEKDNTVQTLTFKIRKIQRTNNIDKSVQAINRKDTKEGHKAVQTDDLELDRDSRKNSINDDLMNIDQIQDTIRPRSDDNDFLNGLSDFESLSEDTNITMDNIGYRKFFLSDLRKVLHCLVNCKLKKNSKEMLLRIYCQAKELVIQHEQMHLNEIRKQKCNLFYEEVEFKKEQSADIPYLQEQIEKLRFEVNLLQNKRIEEANHMESIYHEQLKALDKKNETCKELDQLIEDLRARALRSTLIVENNASVSENVRLKIKNIKIDSKSIVRATDKFAIGNIDGENYPVYTVKDMEMEKQCIHDRHVIHIKHLQSNINSLEEELNKYKAELSVLKCEAKIGRDKYNDLLNNFRGHRQQMQ